MKKKTKMKPVETKPEQTDAQPTPSVFTPDVPHPGILLELAIREEDRRILDEYIQTIQVLRDDKRFTFREIAGWLNENGVETDHNAVYRAYMRHVPEEFAGQVARETDDEEREGR
jgi:hypothetical protein